jgi:hypothetical protein
MIQSSRSLRVKDLHHLAHGLGLHPHRLDPCAALLVFFGLAQGTHMGQKRL